MRLTEEQWVPVAGYEGLYSVSDRGRVKSEARRVEWRSGRKVHLRSLPERILRAGRNSYAYKTVTLSREDRRRTHSVHVLVLVAFGGPKGDAQCGRHLDDDRSNNTISNLAWGSFVDNSADAARNGRRSPACGEKSGTSKLTEVQVREIRAASGSQREIAERYGVHQSSVSLIRRGKAWRHLAGGG